jgi:hypothetical protein
MVEKVPIPGADQRLGEQDPQHLPDGCLPGCPVRSFKLGSLMKSRL